MTDEKKPPKTESGPVDLIGRASNKTRSDLDVWKTDIEDKVNENRSKKGLPEHLKTTTVPVKGLGYLESTANGRIALLVLRTDERRLIRVIIAKCEDLKPSIMSPIGFSINGQSIDIDCQTWGHDGLNECWLTMFRLVMATSSYEYQEIEGEPDAGVDLEAIHSVYAGQCGLHEAINAYDKFTRELWKHLDYDLRRQDRDKLRVELGYMERNRIKDTFMRAQKGFQEEMLDAEKQARLMADTMKTVQ